MLLTINRIKTLAPTVTGIFDYFESSLLKSYFRYIFAILLILKKSPFKTRKKLFFSPEKLFLWFSYSGFRDLDLMFLDVLKSKVK